MSQIDQTQTIPTKNQKPHKQFHNRYPFFCNFRTTNQMSNQARISNRTVVDFFINNMKHIPVIMLYVVLLLACLIRRSISVTSPVYPTCPIEPNNEVSESALQTTTRIIDSRIRFLQQEIKNEVKILQNEFTEQIDVFHESCTGSDDRIWAKLLDLIEKVKSIERSITITSSEWITKAEFNNSLEELKSMKGGEKLGFNEEHNAKVLDEMVDLLEEVVVNEIEKHAADGLGRVDYAAEGGGGMVIGFSKAYRRPESERLLQFEDGLHDYQLISAQIMLKPSFGEPGQCFSLNGSSGYVLILLRKRIVPDAITLEHVAESVAYDRSDAPKDCIVYGYLQRREDAYMNIDPSNRILLAKFAYDLEKRNVQTFNVWGRADPYEPVVDIIIFEFESNHGDPTHTCIYRVRVHGHEPDSQATLIVGRSKNDSKESRDPDDELFDTYDEFFDVYDMFLRA